MFFSFIRGLCSRGGLSVVIDAPALTLTAVDADSVDFTVDEIGTAYWLVDDTTNQDAATIKAGGGLASGSFAVTAGANSEAIDLSAVAAGTHRFHMFVEDADGNASNVVEDDLVIASAATQVTVTEFDEQSDPVSKSSYAFTVDLSAVPDGARCISAFATLDSGISTITGVSGATATVTSRVTKEQDFGPNVKAGIAEFTKQTGQTSETITWTLSEASNSAFHWGGALANAHATTVDSTGTGGGTAVASASLDTALTTTNLGIAIAVACFTPGSATATWGPGTPTEHADTGIMSVASFATDGSALDVTLTPSDATGVIALAAIAIPPA